MERYRPAASSARARRLAALPVALAAALVGGGPDASPAHAERASAIRSLEVVATGVTIRAAPSTHAPRRGTVRQGTALPVEARVPGLGCAYWYRVGAERFVCESLVRPSSEPPRGEALPVVPEGELLPRPQAFVATDGTWAYARPSDYFLDEMVQSLGRGFGLSIVERRVVEGVPFLRTLGGLWVAEESVRFARGSPFFGVELGEGPLDVAWTTRATDLYAWNGRSRGRVLRRLGRRQVLHVRGVAARGWLETSEGVVSERDVQRPSPSEPPEGVGERERWIDVELASQTLVAYEGRRPVFATLVSTGRPGPGHETPRGVHRVWVKLAEDTMDDLTRVDQETNYAIEGVPWVQYFRDGVALHAAFWHDDFGRPRSHGCVNLAPRDARWLFAWTEPALPPGWDAILTSEAEPGTIVRVR